MAIDKLITMNGLNTYTNELKTYLNTNYYTKDIINDKFTLTNLESILTPGFLSLAAAEANYLAKKDINKTGIYTPTTAGSAGQVLTATGEGAPVWSSDYYTKTEVDSAAQNLITAISSKSSVSVSNEGTSNDEISYITIDGVEKKIKSGSGSSAISTVISEQTAQLLLDEDKTTTITSSDEPLYTDFNSLMNNSGTQLVVTTPDNSISVKLIEESYFKYGEYGETKTFEYAMPIFIRPRKIIIWRYNDTIALRVTTNEQIEFNSISTPANSSLNTSYDHHYISFMSTSTLINDEINTDKIIFKLIDANKYITTPFISSYNGAMHPMTLAIPYQDYYFIIGKYKVIARYFSNIKTGWNLINSSNNNSDPFADTPSTSLEGLVLACINDQGIVDNTLTDEFAQTYFVGNCIIKVMGKGAFDMD